jgi:hypothetical protein
MRFLSISKTRETNARPTAELMTQMGQLITEMTEAGVEKARASFGRSRTEATVRPSSRRSSGGRKRTKALG